MPNFDRRKLIRSGIALAVPFAAMPLLAACQQSEDSANADNDTSPNVQGSEEKTMQLQYLEIVTPDVDALCKQYSKVHGIAFSEPNVNFGNARTAKLNGGGLIGIRGPLRDSETPVIRPYALVENLEEAVAAAADAGAEIAIQRMEIPGGHGTIAVVIQGGIECGLWQL